LVVVPRWEAALGLEPGADTGVMVIETGERESIFVPYGVELNRGSGYALLWVLPHLYYEFGFMCFF
jgi:hypothetical protein